MRLDPVELLPREVTLKVFGYLDAITLGRAAQVSRAWKGMADDDLLWRTMCEQHIERKCEKCGWGLPLLGERRRKARLAMNALPTSRAGETSRGRDSDVRRMLMDTATSAMQAQVEHQHLHHHGEPFDPAAAAATATSSSSSSSDMLVEPSSSSAGAAAAAAASSSDSHRHKRSKTSSPTPSRPSSPRPSRFAPAAAAELPPALPLTRPWKHVYCERLAIERNWRRGTCAATVLSGHTDSITCLQVAEDLPHPSFPVLMTGSWDRSVRIWNLETGKEVGVLRGHTRGVRALQFDALKLVTGSMDSTLKIWNWRTGECMRTLRGHRDAVICLTYDKQLLVSGSGDSTIRVWDFGTGEVYTLRGHSEWVNSVALWDSKADGGCDPSPASLDAAAARASAGTGTSATTGAGDLGAPISNPEQAKQSSMGKYLFSASDDATIRVWDLYSRTCVRVLSGHVAQVQSLKVYVVGPGEDQGTAAFPTSLLQPPATTPGVDESDRTEDAAGLAGAGAGARPSCTANQRLVGAPPASAFPGAVGGGPFAQQQQQPDFEFASDKKPMVVSASLDNTVRVWNVESGQCVRQQFGHLEGVWSVDVDKLRIVSGSHDRTIKVRSSFLSLSGIPRRRRGVAGADSALSLPLSPAPSFASQIWDRDSGKNLHTIVGHKAAVCVSLALPFLHVREADSPPVPPSSLARSTSVLLTDQSVISGSDDGEVRLWSFAPKETF